MLAISMDGKGRCLDNVFVERLWRSLKYEEVYLHAYDNGVEARSRRHRPLPRLLQRRAPTSEPWLSHAAASVRSTMPVDMWTIGFADRLRFPHFPSPLEKRGNARLRPHTHRHDHQHKD